MTPADFRDFVVAIAGRRAASRATRLILGGDHLGPNPWQALPADAAMDEAEAMVAAYVDAGFAKIHLDASMGCAGEPAALADEVIAARAARLAAVAEARRPSGAAPPPVYVIGTEVPAPGGAHEALDHLAPTPPEAARTLDSASRGASPALGLGGGLGRVLAVVVQPGVEFGHRQRRGLRARARRRR